jgi:transketolase
LSGPLEARAATLVTEDFMEKPSASRRIAPQRLEELKKMAHEARAGILRMTRLADSGHPGGSMSSIDILLTLYEFARIVPERPRDPRRDRVIISHGHVSPAVYMALCHLGFHDCDEAIATFRLAGSSFEGHIERHLPGIEWTTGNLGQGLSAGCGMALAARLLGTDNHVFVAMSDGEQAKGQVGEARRFAVKYGLSNLTVIIDYNHIQISGRVEDVMPVRIKDNFVADGWRVIEIDGHDIDRIHEALVDAVDDDAPTCIIAETVIGKGVSFMEGRAEYHGRALTAEEFDRAMAELGFDADLSRWKELRAAFAERPYREALPPQQPIIISGGTPRTYEPGTKIDNRSAFGNALVDLARENRAHPDAAPIAVFDCDLASSVKVNGFAKEFSDWFFEAGVSEHNTAAMAGALSSQGVVTFHADFGVFGIDEVYNQLRLNDINATNLKVVVTHCGIDVGQDGRTHHCLDYVGALRNFYGFKVIVPADANQTDRAIRYAATTHGNFVIAMGRGTSPIITREDGAPFFGNDYEFEYGAFDRLRSGADASLICMGMTAPHAIAVHDILKERRVSVAVYHAACPLAIPVDGLREAAKTGLVVTYEDHNVRSGLGFEIAGLMAEHGIAARLVRLGVAGYAPSGAAADLYRLQGLDAESVAERIINELERGGRA